MMELGRLGELLEHVAEQGSGLSVMPVQAGMREGGFGSDRTYAADGWAIGLFSQVGGEDIAVASSIAEAVELAFVELRE